MLSRGDCDISNTSPMHENNMTRAPNIIKKEKHCVGGEEATKRVSWVQKEKKEKKLKGLC